MNPDGTGTGTPPENAQPTNVTVQAELEAARKDAEQAKMRANQLANELADRKKVDDDAAEAKLKANEEYKTLYEAEQAKRQELEEKTNAEKKTATAQALTAELTKGYSKEVLEVAEAAGINLTDATDEAQAQFKARLDAITQKVGPGRSPVTGNNIRPNVPASPEREKLMTGMRVGSAQARHEYLKDLPAIAAMRQMAGVNPPTQ